MSRTATKTTTNDGSMPPRTGSRMADKSAPPDDRAVRQWIGPEAFVHWTELRKWIDESYLGVFEPDWLYGGKNRGWSLRYKQTRAFCTLVPEYDRFSVVVVMGRTEREKFEERRYGWRPSLVNLYDETKAYIDGKWLTVAISTKDDLHELMELLAMKRPPHQPTSGRGRTHAPSRRKSKHLRAHE